MYAVYTSQADRQACRQPGLHFGHGRRVGLLPAAPWGRGSWRMRGQAPSFVCPPPLLASSHRHPPGWPLMGRGKQPACPPSTWVVGVGWALLAHFGVSRLAPLHVQQTGGRGGGRKARSTAARSRPCKMAVTLSFSPTVSCSPTPMRVNICRELAGRVVCIKQTSPHTSYLAPTPTSSISTPETLGRPLRPHPAQLSCTLLDTFASTTGF